MTENLFKKAAVFTDIHFGLKSNSKIHNDDCEAFVVRLREGLGAGGVGSSASLLIVAAYASKNSSRSCLYSATVGVPTLP